jgi:GTP-binding protein
MEASYIISAQKFDQLPAMELPEIAIIGRSNCGKSSLINSLTNRKDLAFSSRTPGRTQMANYFKVNNKFYIVDLPGYGFSATGGDARDHWEKLLETYIERTCIVRFLFLLDVRRDWQEDDVELAHYLSQKIPLTIVFTKADKLNKSDQVLKLQNAAREAAELDITCDKVFLVSNLKKTGIDELREFCFSMPVANSD